MTSMLITETAIDHNPQESQVGCGLPFCYTDEDRECLEASEGFETIPSDRAAMSDGQ